MRANLLQTSSTKASADASAAGLRIALFLEEESGNWHVRRLAEALRARGADVVVSSLPRCAFDTQLASGIDIPGFDGELPDAVFVRSISQARSSRSPSASACCTRCARAACACGTMRAPSSAASTSRRRRSCCTRPASRRRARAPWRPSCPADAYVAGAERPLIYKPLFGSQGKGLLRVDDVAGLPAAGGRRQHLLPAGFRAARRAPTFEDWRVIVTRARVVAAMTRRAGNWITNVHQGGAPSAHEPSEEMAQLASAALAAVGADYGGVDLIRTPDGRLLVLEVNSNPSWRGLQSVTDIDIARSHRRGFPARRRRASATHTRAACRAMPGLSAAQIAICSSPPAAPSSRRSSPATCTSTPAVTAWRSPSSRRAPPQRRRSSPPPA